MIIRVPASTANIGPGFDALGLALKLYNHFDFTMIEEQGTEPSESLILSAYNRAVADCGRRAIPISVQVRAEVPQSRGLGSSACCIVAGVLAANYYAQLNLSKADILALATEYEGHPDNVCPALFGGLQLSQKIDGQVLHHPFELSKDLEWILLIPDFELSTRSSRGVLGTEVPRADAVANLAAVPILLEGLKLADYELLNWGMRDQLHQPQRAKLIPNYYEIERAVKTCGYPGLCLSGAGPALLTVRKHSDKAWDDRLRSLLPPAWRLSILQVDLEGAVTAIP